MTVTFFGYGSFLPFWLTASDSTSCVCNLSTALLRYSAVHFLLFCYFVSGKKTFRTWKNGAWKESKKWAFKKSTEERWKYLNYPGC